MEFNKIYENKEKGKSRFSEISKEKNAFCLFIVFLIACSVISIFTDLPFFRWTWYLLQYFLLWIAADFITGIIHWWEDAYGNPNWKIIGKYIVEPNLIHHKQPNKLLEGSYWNRINTSFFAAAIIGLILCLVGLHSWQVIVCLLFCTQGNEIHAMSHRPDKSTNTLIRFLQKTGLFQSKKMHRWHHKAPYDTNFCIMSDFVNPILNKIKFWTKLEYLILKTLKIDVLRASSIRKGL